MMNIGFQIEKVLDVNVEHIILKKIWFVKSVQLDALFAWMKETVHNAMLKSIGSGKRLIVIVIAKLDILLMKIKLALLVKMDA